MGTVCRSQGAGQHRALGGEGRRRELGSWEGVGLGVLGAYGGLGTLWGIPSRHLLFDLFCTGIHLRLLPRKGWGSQSQLGEPRQGAWWPGVWPAGGDRLLVTVAPPDPV